jgi:hypothetical protein
MEENKTKVSPTESYLLKRVKELEKENKKLKFDLSNVKLELEHKNKVVEETTTKYHELYKIVDELALDFELQTEESETFNYLRFDGSFFKTLYKELEKNSSGEQHLINFLNYVKENL